MIFNKNNITKQQQKQYTCEAYTYSLVMQEYCSWYCQVSTLAHLIKVTTEKDEDL